MRATETGRLGLWELRAVIVKRTEGGHSNRSRASDNIVHGAEPKPYQIVNEKWFPCAVYKKIKNEVVVF